MKDLRNLLIILIASAIGLFLSILMEKHIDKKEKKPIKSEYPDTIQKKSDSVYIYRY